MHIGGFQKNTLIDFPETIACIIFTQGCNFACPYCHNPDLVAAPRKGRGPHFDEQGIFEFLSKRKGLLDGVVITGGEPTRQKDLIDFCRKVKGLGYRLKIDTNGTHPGMLARLLDENLADYIAMDIKTGLDTYPRLVPGRFDAGEFLASIDLIMDRAPGYEFRTTCVAPFVSTAILHRIGEMIRGASHYILQQCTRDADVLDPVWFKTGDPFFSQEQMAAFTAVAGRYVKTVSLR